MTAVNRQSFLCPLSMATGYLSVLLQPLGGAAYCFLVFLQPPGALRLAARATGSRSGTWVPDLLGQKLTSTTDIVHIIFLAYSFYYFYLYY